MPTLSLTGIVCRTGGRHKFVGGCVGPRIVGQDIALPDLPTLIDYSTVAPEKEKDGVGRFSDDLVEGMGDEEKIEQFCLEVDDLEVRATDTESKDEHAGPIRRTGILDPCGNGTLL